LCLVASSVRLARASSGVLTPSLNRKSGRLSQELKASCVGTAGNEMQGAGTGFACNGKSSTASLEKVMRFKKYKNKR